MKLMYRNLTRCLPLLIILPFIIISFYKHPALDDWWYAEVYKQYGVAGAQQYWYTHYTARFFSNFIMTVAPLSFGWIEGYKVMPVVFLCALFGTFSYITKVFFKNFTVKYALPLWFTVTYLLVQRDYFECLYWLSATVVYQFTMLFFMLHVTIMYQLYFTSTTSKLKYIVAILLAVAVTGSNETLGGLVLAESLFLLLYSFKKKRWIVFSLALLFALLISWTVMFMARGNWSKIEAATNEHIYTFNLLLSIKYSLISAGYYSVFLIKQLSFWCLVILSIPVWQHFIQRLNLAFKNLFLLLAILCFAIAFAIYFISIYPTGILIPPLRVTNIAIIFLFAGISLAVVWASEKFATLKNCISFLNQHKSAVMIACFVFAIVTPTKYQQLLTDITSGKAQAYNKAMYSRYTILKNYTLTQPFHISKLTSVPRTIVATDVSGPVSENIGLIFGKKYKVIIE